MRLRKRVLGIILSFLVTANLFCFPVSAAEYKQENILSQASITSVSGYEYAGTIYRYGGTNVSCGRVTLVGASKIYIKFPRNGNLDLYQGTVTFRKLGKVVTKQVTNMSKEVWTFDKNSVGEGIWSVNVNGYAIGTSQKCQVWYKTGN